MIAVELRDRALALVMASGVSPMEARDRVERGEYRWQDMMAMIESRKMEGSIATSFGVFPVSFAPVARAGGEARPAPAPTGRVPAMPNFGLPDESEAP